MKTCKMTRNGTSPLVKTALVGLLLGSSLAWGQMVSMEEIYQQTCAHCHGEKAQGVPDKKAPPLNTMPVNALSYELFNLTATNQSSGSDHEIMEHNQKKIVEKGIRYHPDDMARYIYISFNPTAATEVDEKGYRKYSTAQVYEQMCAKCHGAMAEGNAEKKGPPLNTYSLQELEMELLSLREGFQSSGGHHEVMSETLKRIENKGMRYHPKDMATHIYFRYNKDAKK
ncbi:MAG: c-type cytochrome [Campylobacterales bacterium]|nr:c-type cytochrome [Campylobacterales bacterium]